MRSELEVKLAVAEIVGMEPSGEEQGAVDILTMWRRIHCHAGVRQDAGLKARRRYRT